MRENGANWIGLFLSSQFTWGTLWFAAFWTQLTSFISNYGSERFFYIFNYSQLGTLMFNWFGIAYAQYLLLTETDESLTSAFLAADNIIALGIAALYNFISFGILERMRQNLCNNPYY